MGTVAKIRQMLGTVAKIRQMQREACRLGLQATMGKRYSKFNRRIFLREQKRLITEIAALQEELRDPQYT